MLFLVTVMMAVVAGYLAGRQHREEEGARREAEGGFPAAPAAKPPTSVRRCTVRVGDGEMAVGLYVTTNQDSGALMRK